MRIIGGRWKGRRLAKVPAGVRPTSDRLRGTLFDILADRCDGCVWLDGFSGTGGVGLEALSRGARHVCFAEKDRDALRVLRKNLELCGADSGFEIFEDDILRFPGSFSGEVADVLFLDPPYAFHSYGRLLTLLNRSPACGPESIVVLEFFKKTTVDFVPPEMTVIRRVKAGNSHLLGFALLSLSIALITSWVLRDYEAR